MSLKVCASLVLLVALGVGCKTQPHEATDAGPSTKAKEAKAAAWAPPSSAPAEFTGTLTVERIASAKSLLPAPQSEPKAFPLLLARLGKPTKVTTRIHPLMGKEQKLFAWAAKSGSTCASYHVVEQPNALPDWPPFITQDTGGGTFEMPRALPTNDGSTESHELVGQWEEYTGCVAVLGEEPGLPADAPGAAGPGPLSTKADIVAGLRRAPSKWLGKTVTVEGLLGTTGNLTIKTAKGSVDCRVRTGVELPSDTIDKPKARRVRGKVADLRVPATWGVDLVDCELL